MDEPMQKRMHRWRWERSPLLWIGGLGLVFIFWAWADSGKYKTGGGLALGDVAVGVMQWEGRVDFSEIRVPGGGLQWGWNRTPLATVFSGVPSGELLYFALPVNYVETDLGDGPHALFSSRSLQIAHWVVALVYSAVWAGLMRWRARRAGASE